MVIPPKKQNRQLGQICPCEYCKKQKRLENIKKWLDKKSIKNG